ncbi:hypothetical protein ACIA5D_36785 [Actinoplanes sp. NPDC051513]|uniref:hypothetical protein n=1 Tax=Actinoplanes sp. NPDC051513 TaxID=3363908 RepID=UPI0037975900
MTLPEVLDVIERLLNAAEHPDIVRVERYGTGAEAWGPTVEKSQVKTVTGVKVHHQSTSSASLWGSNRSDLTPVEAPEMPAPGLRGPRLAILTVRLLDVARPPQFSGWQLFSVAELAGAGEGLPFAVGITCADGSRVLLQASSTGASVGREPDVEPFPDYVVPEGLAAAVR